MSTPGPCRLSPANPAGYAELLIRGRIDRALARPTGTARELGASAIEWVIISALLVGIAVAVGTVLLQKLQAKADSIDLDAGTP
jgi:hypothetical protein